MLDSEDAGDLESVREHTSEIIRSAFHTDDPVLVEGPPSSGKTTSTLELCASIDTPVTYLAGRTDLYEQAEEILDDHELTYQTIPSPHRDCPTFTDDNDGDDVRVKRLYAKGFSGRRIHFLPKSQAHTPCVTDDCPYLEATKEIDEDIEAIDVLIGHHSHSHRQGYVADRVVVLDEFNADPFLTRFPNPASGITDDPGSIIAHFLKEVRDTESIFPSDLLEDTTDLIEHRNSPQARWRAFDWFRRHGASRRDAEDLEFLNPSVYRHDETHLTAPFLTFATLNMHKVGPGMEMAPHPDADHLPAWGEIGLNPGQRCLRNRNTGEMYTFEPPNLAAAEQVIGLDGTPTVELWNLLLPPGKEFDHQLVVDRSDLVTYLNSAMNMSIIQIGDGMHHYGSGRVSKIDDQRFAAIRSREGRKFPLISTKQALERYDQLGWLDRSVQPMWESTVQGGSSRKYNARNYATVKSSNEFKKESLGVVAGAPHPGDTVVRVWAGLCGKPAQSRGSGEDKTFGEFGDRIYQHLSHNQVVQAILRFGRDESVWAEGGATVYVSTAALPSWFQADQELTVQSDEKQNTVILALYDAYQTAARPALAYHTAGTLREKIEDASGGDSSISTKHVRNTLNRLCEEGVATTREDAGPGGADLFRWEDSAEIVETSKSLRILNAKSTAYVIPSDLTAKLGF